ncbi:MAG: nuclear transport factor 2 family protein [Vulcanimicrobiaceae bacterium]
MTQLFASGLRTAAVGLAIALIVIGQAAAAPPAAPAIVADSPAATANARLVLDFFQAVFVDHHVSAIPKYVADAYVQHSPYVPDGVKPFTEYATALFDKYPLLAPKPKQVVAAGDLVVLHSLYEFVPGTRGTAAVDIFRIANGKIVEHWDVLQPVPEQAANAHPMF